MKTGNLEELLQPPYWIIDILPKQVPKDSPGQYFAVEKYFLGADRLAAIKQKHINLILKLNCYRDLAVCEEPEINPSPEKLADRMKEETVFFIMEEAVILSEPDDTHMTVFHPDEQLLELIKEVAAGEGLFVWQPPM